MSNGNLSGLFAPRSIALIGASDRPGSVGNVVAANLLAGGFKGELMYVDHSGRPVHGQPVVSRIEDLPAPPDLAVIATPAAVIPELISALGARGCRAAIVISAGFEGEGAADLRQAMLAAARITGLRIIGPNCLGFLSPAQGVNASFARGVAPAGGVALLSQSGAVAAAALDWAGGHGLGFSQVVTLGDALEVDLGDLLDALGPDPTTRAVLIYVESLRNAPKFLSAARAIARRKPTILLKGGRSPAGARAAFSHTRALAGADAVYSAALRQAGVLQVDTLEDLLAAGLVFAEGRIPAADDLIVLTNGGGAGVLAADALERAGGRLATLSASTQAALRSLLPPSAAVSNPVDILGDAPPELYGQSLNILLRAAETASILVLNCPTAVADSTAAADVVVAAHAAAPSDRRVFAAWLGEASVEDGRHHLASAGVPTFETPEAAVRAFAQQREAQRRYDLEIERPVNDHGAEPRAKAAVAAALAEGRTALEPPEIAAVLAAYGIPLVETRVAATPEDAGRAAATLGGQVVLKILSPDLTHKSDAGGVQLGLRGKIRTANAAQAMIARLKTRRPEARLEGFLVQPMIDRPKGQEVLAGLVRDPTFGPVVVVGQGGVAVEVLADRALGLPPLNRLLAHDMIAQTRVSRLLAGYRDRPACDLDALADLLIALGRLAVDIPEIAELDLNPVLCDAAGIIVVDARIAIRPRVVEAIAP
jgi:acetyltransferase